MEGKRWLGEEMLDLVPQDRMLGRYYGALLSRVPLLTVGIGDFKISRLFL